MAGPSTRNRPKANTSSEKLLASPPRAAKSSGLASASALARASARKASALERAAAQAHAGTSWLPQLLATVLHGFGALMYVLVFAWHFTSEASYLPGAFGFGFFFKYLTFYAFTLQMISLIVVFVSDLRPRHHGLRLLADDLVCTLFSFANMVSVLYYVTLYTVADSVEEAHIKRPVLLSEITHLFNSVVFAWGDLLLVPRRFSGRARAFNGAALATYIVWINICAFFNGRYPYPFLNRLPFPAGIVAMTAVSLAGNYAFFFAGKIVAAAVHPRALAAMA